MSFVPDVAAIPTTAAAEFATQARNTAVQQPTQSQKFLAEYRNPIVGGTVASHTAHYQYLSKVKQVTSRRVYGAAGVAWAAAYVGVLSATTIAEARVNKSTCPVENNKR